MGPRSCDRGSLIDMAGLVAFGLLQWGRGHVTAEVEHVADVPRRVAGASMGPRSCDRGSSLLIPLAGPVRPTPASMGPRSCDRGSLPQTRRPVPKAELQWGRGHVTAEVTQEHPRTVRFRERFNGAAVM